MAELMREVNLCGTAIGTGVNASAGFASVACRHLSEVSGVEVRPASNLIEATSNSGAFVSISSMLKRIILRASCIDGIEADVARCRELYDRSLIHAASLNPMVGYNKAATLAKIALASAASLWEVVASDTSLSVEQRRSILLLLA